MLCREIWFTGYIGFICCCIMKVLWKWDAGCVYNEETVERRTSSCMIFIFLWEYFTRERTLYSSWCGSSEITRWFCVRCSERERFPVNIFGLRGVFKHYREMWLWMRNEVQSHHCRRSEQWFEADNITVWVGDELRLNISLSLFHYHILLLLYFSFRLSNCAHHPE